MAHYLLSVLSTTADYVDVDYDDPKIQKMFADTNAFNEQLQADGHWVYANGLTNITDATVVDNTAGDVTVTDGPYAETKEFLGGFWIVDAPDLDVALKLAAAGSRACQSKVEVRPMQADPTAQ